MTWMDDIRKHYSDREELDADQLLAEFAVPNDITAQELVDVLRVFQEEYDVPPGKLRAADPLSWFTDPPPSTRNPLTAMWEFPAYEDRLSELEYHIKKGRSKAGALPLARQPTDLREYVLAVWASLGRGCREARRV